MHLPSEHPTAGPSLPRGRWLSGAWAVGTQGLTAIYAVCRAVELRSPRGAGGMRPPPRRGSGGEMGRGLRQHPCSQPLGSVYLLL